MNWLKRSSSMFYLFQLIASDLGWTLTDIIKNQSEIMQ